jgi:hypothetical protein
MRVQKSRRRLTLMTAFAHPPERCLVHIAAIGNGSAGTAHWQNLALVPFNINGYWIARGKRFIERLVEKVVNMRQCGWRCLEPFLFYKHDLRSFLSGRLPWMINASVGEKQRPQ